MGSDLSEITWLSYLGRAGLGPESSPLCHFDSAT